MGQVPDLSSKSRTQGDRACEIQVQRRLKLMTSEKRISTLSGWVLMWIIWCRTGGGDSPLPLTLGLPLFFSSILKEHGI